MMYLFQVNGVVTYEIYIIQWLRIVFLLKKSCSIVKKVLSIDLSLSKTSVMIV